MVKALRAFLEFCYVTWCNVHDTRSLKELDDMLQRYHCYHEIFITTCVWTRFNLPHQYALIHYSKAIRQFGALNGLCSSITESKHIEAVKEPWRRSSRFDVLCQMLITNEHANKLAAARANFKRQGMLQGTCLSWILNKLGMFQWFCCQYSGFWPLRFY